ncbi:hypothetical protein [Bacillus sp. KH172YL63]|uniref:hypothetical protein n=1 Tax=Bacillus sp. KH172YL63 TaxID=2709784 RepID=UPI0013E446E8|nr:hypothetical protein [Bacillus sp. KH172YL63]BCB03912.1 hypothetical protein KH172YL63_20450 [Bacillus sp. KH172YL63]
MLKKRIFWFLLPSLLISLTGCRLDFTENKSSVQQMVKNDDLEKRKTEGKGQTDDKMDAGEKEKPAYTFDAEVTLNSTEIHVEGNSTFPPGIILYTRLRAYPEEASIKDIQAFQVDAYTKVISDNYMVISEDGSFKSHGLERPDFPRRYILELIFAPTRAEETIQRKLVKDGESVEDLPGMIPIDMPTRNEFLEDVVPGYMKHVNIMASDEPDGDQVQLTFTQVEQ